MVLFWSPCKEQLRKSVNKKDFEAYVDPIVHTGNDNILTLHCPNRRSLAWLKNNSLSDIKLYIHQCSAQSLSIEVKLKCLPTPKIPSHLETRKINLNYNFDTFIESSYYRVRKNTLNGFRF